LEQSRGGFRTGPTIGKENALHVRFRGKNGGTHKSPRTSRLTLQHAAARWPAVQRRAAWRNAPSTSAKTWMQSSAGAEKHGARAVPLLSKAGRCSRRQRVDARGSEAAGKEPQTPVPLRTSPPALPRPDRRRRRLLEWASCVFR